MHSIWGRLFILRSRRNLIIVGLAEGFKGCILSSNSRDRVISKWGDYQKLAWKAGTHGQDSV